MDGAIGTEDQNLTAIRPATLARAQQAVLTLQQALKLGRLDSATRAAAVISEYLDAIDREMRA